MKLKKIAPTLRDSKRQTVKIKDMTINKNPSDEPLIPVSLSDCVEWRILADEYVQQSCTAPIYTLTIGGGTSSNGQTFSIDGEVFITDDSVPYTSSTVDLSGGAAQQAANLAGMLNSNSNFIGRAAITVAGNVVTITYYECRDDLVFELVNVSQIVAAGDAANMFLQTLNGFKLVYQLFGLSILEPLTDLEVADPIYFNDQLHDNSIQFQNFFCARFANCVQLPAPPYNVAFKNDECVQKFFLRYGYASLADNNCDMIFSDIQYTQSYIVLNAKPEIDLALGIRNYVYSPIGMLAPLVQFMTCAPIRKRMCANQFEWLRTYMNINDQTGGTNTYDAQFTFIDSAGAQISTDTVLASGTDGMLVFPVGAGNMNVTMPAGTVSYRVQLLYNNLPVTESREYYLDDACCYEDEEIELYFLNQLGHYDTIRFEQVQSQSIQTSGTEICRDVPCDGTLHERLTNRKMMTDFKAEQQYTLRLEVVCTEDMTQFLRAFKASPAVFKRHTAKDGQTVMRHFSVQQGASQIFQWQNRLVLTTTGSIDVPALC